MNDVFVIAEAGVNHNGCIDLAYELVDAAVYSGADAIKFQTFKTGDVLTKSVEKAKYQKRLTDESESQYEMIKKLELNYDQFSDIKKYCDDKGIKFMSTAFDLDSVKFLSDNLSLDTLKIASGEITNGPLLLTIGRTDCNIILSTGMSTLSEIRDALAVIAYGFLDKTSMSDNITYENIYGAYGSELGRKFLRNKVLLMHCTTEYPALYSEINLNAMLTMKNEFGLRVGYSDHSNDLLVPVVSASIGAEIIEKHLTLDKGMKGPDHAASIEPEMFRQLVNDVRNVRVILGSEDKKPVESEIKNKKIARKVLVASSKINEGDLFTDENMAVKRAGLGVSPMKFWDYVGKVSDKCYFPDDVIE